MGRDGRLIAIMHILFFAQLKDATKCDRAELRLSRPLNVDQVWEALLVKFPGLAAHRASVRLARNSEYADAKTIFSDVDELALIPPVSGG